MGIDTAHYHGWQGQLRPPSIACLAIVRVALVQVFRRKGYWFVLALGLLNFLFFFAVIYAVTQIEQLPEGARRDILKALGFTALPDEQGETGYIRFMDRQSAVVMILLAFSGSLLVGADFRLGSLPFYLSRRIDRRHYILGKILAVMAVVSLITILPAIVLFIEYGLFTSSFDYWLDNIDVLLGVLGYGLVMAAVLSIMIVTLSAYLKRTAPIAIVWSSLFVMLGLMANLLSHTLKSKYWLLLDPWRDIRYVGRLWFSSFREGKDGYLGWWALLIVSTVCGLLLLALIRRVRAVEVVT